MRPEPTPGRNARDRGRRGQHTDRLRPAMPPERRTRAWTVVAVTAATLAMATPANAGDNTVPIAFTQSVTTLQNMGIDIVLDGQDIDDDELTFVVVDDPAHGVLSGVPPQVRYTPDEDYAGADSFTFQVNDGQADSDIATVSVVVEEDFNDPPQAQSQAVVTQVGTPLDITLTATDDEGDDLTFEVTAGPEHGALSGQAPNLTYTPEDGYEGPDSFTFVANDGVNDSGEATVFIDVGAVNGIPVALDQNLVTPVNTPVAFVLTGQDPNNDPLTFSVTVQPENGTLSGQPPNLTYTPDDDYTGIDAVMFVANDGMDDSEPAVIALLVGINAAPVVQDITRETDVNVAVQVVLTGSDEDDDPLTFQVADEPGHGTLSGDPPNLTYTPEAEYTGLDQFSYVASDGQTISNVGTVTVLVGVENIAPFGISKELTTPANTALDILLEGADPEGQPLVFAVIDSPEHGALGGQTPNLLYAPEQDYNGRDSFTFTVSDGEITSAPARIDLVVGVLNQIPSALDLDVETPVDESVAVTLRGLDGDGDELTYTLVTTPSSGQLSGQAPNLTYTPNQGFEGLDIFTYTVNDGLADSEVGIVNLRVGDPNLPPLANPITVNTEINVAVDVTLDGVDPEGRALTYAIAVQPFSGTVTGDGQTVTYTPESDFQGTDFFSYTVNDGVQDSDAGLVRVRVGVPNEAPFASPALVQVDEDSVVGIVLMAEDADGDDFEFEILTQPIRGSLEGTAPTLRYTPPANFHGFDNFDFRVNDGVLDSNIATIVIEVLPVNDPPVTSASVVITTENTAVGFALTADDPDGDNLDFQIVTPPSQGQLTGDPPNLVYTPNEGFTGEDALVYVASDGEASSEETTVRILVDAVNEAPTATDGEATTAEDVPVQITLDAEDPDGDDLQFVITQSPSRGVVQGTGPTVTYIPEEEYAGGDSFRYLVSDGRLQSLEAEVVITITPVDDPPEAIDSLVTTDEGVEVPVPLFAFDPDTEELTYAITRSPENGTLEGTAPELVYVPGDGFSGEDSFAWTASDGNTTSNEATVRVRVFAENQENLAPTAIGSEWSTDEDVAVAITLQGDDFNGDELLFTIVEFPGRGQLTGQAPNLVYTPQADSNGDDFFTFTVDDGEFTSDPAVARIAVAPINDAPLVFPLLINTNQGRPVSFGVVGDDPEQSPLTYEIVEEPANGTLVGDLPDLTYTPDDAFFGDDTFVVRASDGMLWSDPATITLRVRRANNIPPTAQELSVETDEDSGVDFVLQGSDADGDLIVFILQQLPDRGAISGNAPDLRYEPAANFFGEETMTFLVNDGTQNSQAATVTFTVHPVNDPPVATDVRVTTVLETAVDADLTATDIDSDELNYTIRDTPQRGTASISGTTATYTPEDGFVGTDSFTFAVSDGELEDTGTVTIEVFGGDPDAPVVTIDTLPAWAAAPANLIGSVTDGACQTAPTVTLSPLDTPVAVSTLDDAFGFASDPLPGGVHTLTVAAVSGCTGRTGRATITLGVDAEAPQLTVSGLDQNGVDPEDLATWPSVDPATPLRLTIQATDSGSGIAEVHASAADAEGDTVSTLRATVLEVRMGVPPAGLGTFNAAACDTGEHCDGDGFDAGGFQAGAVEISVRVRDVTGQESVRVIRLRSRGLRDAVEDLRDAAFAQSTQSPQALSSLDAAVAQLDGAVAELDAARMNNVVIAVMQGFGHLKAAARFDEAATFDREKLEIVQLLRAQVGERLDNAVDELGDGPELALAAGFLSRADAHARSGEADDALLGLSNAWLWIDLATSAPSTDSPAQLLATFESLLEALDAYGRQQGAPSADAVAASARGLLVLSAPLEAYAQDPTLAIADGHLAVSVLDNATVSLESLVAEGVWNREWLAELALITRAVHAAVVEQAASELGEEHVLVLAGAARIEASSAYWTEGRADSTRGVNRELRCVTAAMDQVTGETLSEVPARCCRLFEAWRADEPGLDTPPNCR